MTIEALSYINRCIESLNIPYEFLQWTDDLTFPYFVGEYSESEITEEDGKDESTFIITGISNSSYLSLVEIKDKIKKLFTYHGKMAILESGSGIAISYMSSFTIPTNEQGLYRLQINLSVKEWRNE